MSDPMTIVALSMTIIFCAPANGTVNDKGLCQDGKPAIHRTMNLMERDPDNKMFDVVITENDKLVYSIGSDGSVIGNVLPEKITTQFWEEMARSYGAVCSPFLTK